MRKLNHEEVKRIQLDILQAVQDWCIKNGVNFWVDSGTLLGAIRHKGYIPWDDDIDLGMLRPDYDRFLKEFNEDNTFYKCYCVENNKECPYAFIKVMDTRTVLYEPDENGMKLHINIDIFVYDNAPDDEKEIAKMFKKRDRLWLLRYLKLPSARSKKFYKNVIKAFAKVALCLFPKNYFAEQIVKNSKKYADQKTDRIGNFYGTVKAVCEKSVFDEFIFVDFEDMQVKAPRDYDKWLTCLYGDYMKLPPEEKRVSHHAYIAYAEE